MSPKNLAIHQRALRVAKAHRENEYEVVLSVQDVITNQVYKDLNKKCEFLYIRDVMKFSPRESYYFRGIARKCLDVPLLNQSLRSLEISVAQASRLLSVITVENSASLIEFTTTHTWDECEHEYARLNPQREILTRFKVLSGDKVSVKGTISMTAFKKYQRVETLLAQKLSRQPTFDEVLDRSLGGYIDKHDPVVKAERAEKRKGEVFCGTEKPSAHPNAAQKHAANYRDKGQCTFIGPDGKRCTEDRWLHLHHIIHRAHGGSHEPDNLTTLCAFHHDLVHQMEFVFDGPPRSTLRAPFVGYFVH